MPRPAGKQTLVRWCKKVDGVKDTDELPSYGIPFPKKGDTAATEVSLKDIVDLKTEEENLKPEFTVSGLLRTVD